jgi:hypothetical protein
MNNEIILIDILILWIWFIILALFRKKNKNNEIKKEDEKVLDEFDIRLEKAYENTKNKFLEECEENEIEIVKKYKRKYKCKINKIMTYREIWFFKRLKEYFKEDKTINIFTKIRLADFIDLDKDLSFWERQSLFNKISRKHIDFIITDINWQVKCLIELDDYTHKYNRKTIENDEFKDEIFKELWIPLLRFKIWETWNFNIIKENRI